MLWIKRNLFVAVGGLIALGLLGFGIFYLLTNVTENKRVESGLEEKKDQLQKLYNLDPFPSTTNIAMAKAELQKVRAAVNKTKEYFTPIPYPKVTGPAFRSLLETTIYELQKKAEESSV